MFFNIHEKSIKMTSRGFSSTSPLPPALSTSLTSQNQSVVRLKVYTSNFQKKFNIRPEKSQMDILDSEHENSLGMRTEVYTTIFGKCQSPTKVLELQIASVRVLKYQELSFEYIKPRSNHALRVFNFLMSILCHVSVIANFGIRN